MFLCASFPWQFHSSVSPRDDMAQTVNIKYYYKKRQCLRKTSCVSSRSFHENRLDSFIGVRRSSTLNLLSPRDHRAISSLQFYFMIANSPLYLNTLQKKKSASVKSLHVHNDEGKMCTHKKK